MQIKILSNPNEDQSYCQSQLICHRVTASSSIISCYLPLYIQYKQLQELLTENMFIFFDYKSKEELLQPKTISQLIQFTDGNIRFQAATQGPGRVIYSIITLQLAPLPLLMYHFLVAHISKI